MSRVVIREANQPGDLGWIVAAHGDVYADEFGWDRTFEGHAAGVVGTFATAWDQNRQGAWIAELDGVPVGCVLCVKVDAAAARLDLLLVRPEARGHGIGPRLVRHCVEFAHDRGYQRVLASSWTALVAARPLFQAAGFGLTGTHRHRAFGHELVRESWARGV